MKIEADLTQDEYDHLCFVMGYAMGHLVHDPPAAKRHIRITNKLFAGSASFVPYDENAFDPASPLKRVETQ